MHLVELLEGRCIAELLRHFEVSTEQSGKSRFTNFTNVDKHNSDHRI